MRTPLLLILLVASPLLAGCGSLIQGTPFEPLDDLRTTNPRSLAEGGHSVPAIPPPGVYWQLQLRGLEENPRKGIPSRRFEVTLQLSPVDANGATPQLRLERAALVDDNGSTFRVSRIVVLDEREKKPKRPHEYSIVFELPPNYRFRQVNRITVHWGLQVGNAPVQLISSRFRRQ